MEYEEKLALLSDDDFFTFFGLMKAEPRWVNSAGKRAIQLIGLCHHGESHSAVFDPSTFKVTCFSECGGGMLFHTWVKKVLDVENPQEAKDFVEDWIDGQDIDFSTRIARNVGDFQWQDRPFKVEHIEPLPGIFKPHLDELYEMFDTSYGSLARCLWCTEDGISAETLKLYDVAIYQNRSIILPHHNINGDIVGLYERSFWPLRKDVKAKYPDIPYKELVKYPRAKYVPLLKTEQFIEEEGGKTSWSFPNTQNLYGFHLAKQAIAETGKAIIFEGGKSVMLAHQAGIEYCVATHTFGAHFNHISMLIEAGAKEIYLAFDKQYQTDDEEDTQWRLYEKKTRTLAEKVGKEVDVYRIIDEKGGKLNYKDAPIDQGVEYFRYLLERAEPLMVGGQSIREMLSRQKQEANLVELAKKGKIVTKATEEQALEQYAGDKIAYLI